MCVVIYWILQIEIEKLRQKVVQLEEQIQVKQALDEVLEAKKKIDEIDQTLKDKDEELSSQIEFCNALIVKERSSNDELQEARKELISVCIFVFCFNCWVAYYSLYLKVVVYLFF